MYFTSDTLAEGAGSAGFLHRQRVKQGVYILRLGAHLHQLLHRCHTTKGIEHMHTWMLSQKLDVVVVAVAASFRSVCCMQYARCSACVSFSRCASDRARFCRNAASPACLSMTIIDCPCTCSCVTEQLQGLMHLGLQAFHLRCWE